MAEPQINIIITQLDISGTPGVSRNDIDMDEEITLTNEDNTGINFFKWEILSWPKNTDSITIPEFSGSRTEEFKFTPNTYGTYIIKLTVNKIIFGSATIIIKGPKLNLTYPSTNEVEWGNTIDYNLTILEKYGIFDNISGEINLLNEKK